MFSLLSRGASAVQSLPAAEAISRVADGSLTLVDIRDPMERRMTGTAKGAVTIPLAAFRMKADPRSPEHEPALDVDRPVALYCASGARSQMAASMLLEMGYREVYNLGGLGHWTAAGGALA